MTLTLVNGTLFFGTVVELHLGSDGVLCRVRLQPDDGNEEPVTVNAAQIACWRRGEPVRRPQAVEIPAELLNGPGSFRVRG